MFGEPNFSREILVNNNVIVLLQPDFIVPDRIHINDEKLLQADCFCIFSGVSYLYFLLQWLGGIFPLRKWCPLSFTSFLTFRRNQGGTLMLAQSTYPAIHSKLLFIFIQCELKLNNHTQTFTFNAAYQSSTCENIFVQLCKLWL